MFLKDCVTFLHAQLGPTTGVVSRIYHKVQMNVEIFNNIHVNITLAGN